MKLQPFVWVPIVRKILSLNIRLVSRWLCLWREAVCTEAGLLALRERRIGLTTAKHFPEPIGTVGKELLESPETPKNSIHSWGFF